MSRVPILLLVITSLLGAPAYAAPACRAASEALTRPLVELYTSEGCDSCPPADRWLASRFDAAGERSRAIALAFHVDYWDRLGWKDRFASPEFTERQYQAMHANGASFVYTPQILLQGHDFTGWRNGGTVAIEAASRKPARAKLELEVETVGAAIGVRTTAHVADDALRSDAQLFVAYVDSGLTSDVKAGENRGVRLAHDHVVRTLKPAGRIDRDGNARADLTFDRPGEAGTHPALVAFVQNARNGDVLQVLMLPLAGCAIAR